MNHKAPIRHIQFSPITTSDVEAAHFKLFHLHLQSCNILKYCNASVRLCIDAVLCRVNLIVLIALITIVGRV